MMITSYNPCSRNDDDAQRDIDTAIPSVRLSVCPSLCLSPAGIVVERRSVTGELSLPYTLDLQLMGDHLCG